jgi:hypothetical protein
MFVFSADVDDVAEVGTLIEVEASDAEDGSARGYFAALARDEAIDLTPHT